MGPTAQGCDALRILLLALFLATGCNRSRPESSHPAEAFRRGTDALAAGQLELAIHWLGGGIESSDAPTTPILTANLLHNLAEAHRRASHFTQAAQHAERCAAMRNQHGDTLGAREAQSILAAALTQMGRNDEAIELLLESLPIFERVEDVSQTALIHNNLGVLHEKAGAWDAAHTHFRRAMRLGMDCRDDRLVAMAAINQAIVPLRQGFADEARVRLESARRLAARIPDQSLVLDATLNLANCHLALGNREQARLEIQFVSQALSGAADHAVLALTRGTLATLLLHTGDDAAAYQHLTNVLRITRANHMAEEELQTLLNLSEVTRRLGRHVERAELIARTSTLREKQAAREARTSSRIHPPHPHSAGDAISLRKRLAESRAASNAVEVVEILLDWCSLTNSPDRQVALALLAETEHWLRSFPGGSPWLQQRCLETLAGLQESSGHWSLAAESWSKAITLETAPNLNPSTSGSALRHPRWAGQTAQRWALSLAHSGKSAEALAVADRSRAPSLNQWLQRARFDPRRLLPDTDRQTYSRLREEAARLSRDRVLARATSPGLADTNDPARLRLSQILAELEDLERKALSTNKHTPSASKDVPWNTPLTPIASLPTPHLLLEILPVGDTLVLWAARFEANKPSEPRMIILPFPITRLRDLVQEHRRAVVDTAPDRQADHIPSAQALYNLLITPFQDLLEPEQILIVVPHGLLWEVSLAALVGPEGRFLIEKHPVVLAPSYAALNQLMAREDTRRAATDEPNRVLVVANPSTPNTFLQSESELSLPLLATVPGTQHQAEFLRAQFGARALVLVGPDATRDRFLAELEAADLIHVAAHASHDPEDPYLIGLWLASDGRGAMPPKPGFVGLEDILEHPIRARAVVLSACDSARGIAHHSDGIAGLAWAFLAAGSASCLASQWKAVDASTAPLMEGLYKNLSHPDDQRPCLRKAEALRLVQRQFISGQTADLRWRHPRYWAPFVWIGDPR
jgi:CHAT domain-containing protein